MADLRRLPARLDRKTLCCRAIVEASQGTRGKYAYDHTTGLFHLGGLLPAGMSYPCDFGFVPSTEAADGDPTDVMVLADEPSPIGALLTVRLVGVIEAEQEEEKGRMIRNDRLVAVASVSHLFEQLNSLSALPPRLLAELQQFWVNYNALKGKRFTVLGLKGPQAALAILLTTAKPRRARTRRA